MCVASVGQLLAHAFMLCARMYRGLPNMGRCGPAAPSPIWWAWMTPRNTLLPGCVLPCQIWSLYINQSVCESVGVPQIWRTLGPWPLGMEARGWLRRNRPTNLPRMCPLAKCGCSMSRGTSVLQRSAEKIDAQAHCNQHGSIGHQRLPTGDPSMGLFRTVSEINGENFQFFSFSVYLTPPPPTKGFPLDLCDQTDGRNC